MADGWRLAVMTTCLVVVSALAATACGPAAKQPCPTKYGPGQIGLCIDDLKTAVTKDQEVSVQATITSVSSTALTGKAWWVIAPVGPGQPWERAVFQSEASDLDYSLHYHISLKWDSTVSLRSDFYELALIVHRVNADGSETHADSRQVGPIHLGNAPATQPWLIHHVERTGPVVVSSVSGPQSERGGVSGFSRTVTVANQGQRSRQFAARLEARTLPPGWEDKWWLGKTLYATTPVTSTVASGQTQTVRIDAMAPADLTAAFPDAQFWLLVTSEGQVTDQGLVGGSETFRSPGASKLLRRSPAGSVEVAGIGNPGQWSHGTRANVTVTVKNLTASPQVVSAFWYLAKPHDLQPWTHAAVGGVPIIVTLGPWASQAVVVTADQGAPAGEWELSAWVHNQQSPGALVHSDGLWLAQPITVT
jgi:hypothetical protein